MKYFNEFIFGFFLFLLTTGYGYEDDLVTSISIKDASTYSFIRCSKNCNGHSETCGHNNICIVKKYMILKIINFVLISSLIALKIGLQT